MTIDMVNKPVKAYQGSEPEAAPKQVAITESDPEVVSVKEKDMEDIAVDPGTLKKGTEGRLEISEQRNDSVKRAIEEMNRKSKESEAVFGIHDKTNRVTIKIVDKKSRDIIKEYPPEETLDMIAKVWELAGIVIDEKG